MALGSTQSLTEMSKGKGLPPQAEVAQGVPARLTHWNTQSSVRRSEPSMPCC